MTQSQLRKTNWRASVSQISAIMFATLTFISSLGYDLGPIALIIPPEWKPTVVKISGVATCILWTYAQIQKHYVRSAVINRHE